MKADATSTFQKYLFTFLRIAIGWHFLYEGIPKIVTPNWSSGSYLLNSSGPLAGFFIAMAQNQFLVYFMDYAVIFGLIVIGLALFLGFSTRIAALAGAGLLLLFYVSNPPFSAMIKQLKPSLSWQDTLPVTWLAEPTQVSSYLDTKIGQIS